MKNPENLSNYVGFPYSGVGMLTFGSQISWIFWYTPNFYKICISEASLDMV